MKKMFSFKREEIKAIKIYSSPDWKILGWLISVTLLSSHAIQGILDVNIKILLILSVIPFLVYLIVFNKIILDLDLLKIVVVVLILSILASLVADKSTQILMGLTFVGMLLFVTHSQKFTDSNKFLIYYKNICLVILLGGWIGFIYSINGGQPILYVKNPEGELTLSLFLTTFTNVEPQKIMRASGIMDEPGALAMYSIIFALFNETRRGRTLDSFLVLLLSLITFSLMAWCAFCFFLIYILKDKIALKYIWQAAILLLFSLIVLINNETFMSLVGNRFAIEDGRFVGDNRTNQVIEFFQLINLKIFFQGASSSDYAFDQSSNPFSILWAYGIFMWLPYALTVIWLFMKAINGNATLKFVCVTFAFLLIQRPYLYSMQWGIWIILLLLSIYNYPDKQTRSRIRGW